MLKYYLRIECVDKEFEVSKEDYKKTYLAHMGRMASHIMLPTSFKTGVLYGRIEKVPDEKKADCMSAKHIPLEYRVSFIVVLIDEYAGENAADEISKELQKHKIRKEDVVNIESNLAQLGTSLPFLRIIVWYRRRLL